MATKATEEAKKLLGESIKELENPKGSVFTGVQKLSRAAKLLNNEEVYIWCEIQFGKSKYTMPILKLFDAIKQNNEDNNEKTKEKLAVARDNVTKLKLNSNVIDLDEVSVKFDEASGGFSNIGYIEERYNNLVRLKSNYDGIHYKGNLSKHINYVKEAAHRRAVKLYDKLTFSDIPQTAFDVLKKEIDDKLLDLDPGLAEKLMLAFKRVTTDNPEEWSQALTSCRRLIEKLADNLYPPTNEKINGRSLGKNQYINRLWVFMDKSIESKSDKELAKANVDFIGNYLKSLLNKTQKGVHGSVTRYEAIKAVLHTYLIIGDILDYLDKPSAEGKRLNIHTASLDELESVLGIKSSIAKEIIKLRVEHGTLDEKELASIKGVGPKTISKAKELFSFEIPDN